MHPTLGMTGSSLKNQGGIVQGPWKFEEICWVRMPEWEVSVSTLASSLSRTSPPLPMDVATQITKASRRKRRTVMQVALVALKDWKEKFCPTEHSLLVGKFFGRSIANHWSKPLFFSAHAFFWILNWGGEPVNNANDCSCTRLLNKLGLVNKHGVCVVFKLRLSGCCLSSSSPSPSINLRCFFRSLGIMSWMGDLATEVYLGNDKVMMCSRAFILSD